jgi:predicted protein tyrosine phosphatase
MRYNKILAVCAMGANRSKYIAKYLKMKGYQTKFGGVKEEAINKINPDDIKWAELIIFARIKHKDLFEKKFGKIKKKYIVLGVQDSGKDVPKEKGYLLEIPREEFNRKWTHPNLRKKLKEFKIVD